MQDAKSASRATSASGGWLRALELTAKLGDRPRRTLPVVIEELAGRFGDAPALLSDRESLTFAALADRSRRYARWALEQGVAPGDTVCLLMPNCPDYLAFWLGVTRVGGVVALLNTNLTAASLAHCVAVVEPRHVVVAPELAETLAEASGKDPDYRVWVTGDISENKGDTATRLAFDHYSGEPLSEMETRDVTLADRALCIYTSGTTGLPKAANVSHRRIVTWAYWFAGIMGTAPADRMYDCLPMYHSIGGVVAPASVLVSGGSVVLRERFSARQFWNDIVDWDCTLFQYIGELCRYLAAALPSPRERQHRLRLCCGNGLRADVWEEFRSRFRIPQILEFYAATEGTFSLYNLEGRPGAIGRIPPYLAHRFPAAIVKFDPETDAPLRDAEGRCVRCTRNEVGEAIGRISSETRFEGYTSDSETERKLLRDVFEPGDAWFRTGDLMRQDEKGFFHFVDRVGGSFRWKGENVSTLEVQEAIAACPGIVAAHVYGVAVPGAEGRAGMAALQVDGDFDLATFGARLGQRLPGYARPIFLRIRDELDVTETFKPKTFRLASEGIDPSVIDDPLYCYDPREDAYATLDQNLFAAIADGRVRL
ncbi:long-chain-acyl-CoA synthetase [Bauldia sp.]|uniref:long-chain-acyl-CoA synthetase n=1 Tax=Bauldia sp. TaxID=2575872 RepID=UPI0025BAEDC6|nr:long-chain-acyl-CoA synthetase [Bauldia sp.]